MDPMFKSNRFVKIVSIVLIQTFLSSNISFGLSVRQQSPHTEQEMLSPTIQMNSQDFTAAVGKFSENKSLDKIREIISISEKDITDPMVLDYGDPRSIEAERAGPKCSQLAKMYRNGIPNPLGFNITVDAIRAYYRYNPELIVMIEAVRKIDVTDAKERKAASEKIQEFMRKKTHIPPVLYDKVKQHWIKISRELGYPEGQLTPLAFRGSGIIEDFEGSIPWFSKSIGAQPGQGTTLLNKVGLDSIEPSVIEVIAGLFNDQIFVYRDIQIFFDFVSKMADQTKADKGESEYKRLISLTRKYGYAGVADKLENEKSPGLVKLRAALKTIAEARPEIEEQYKWLEKLQKSAHDILEPMNFTTGIAGLEMVESYISGTGFTSDLGDGFDGSTFARKQGKFPEKIGDDFKGYTRRVKVNWGLGLGPGIVEGKFEPNIMTLFDVSGNRDWIPFELRVGKKQMRLVYLDRAYEVIGHKYNSERVKRLAGLYRAWQYPDQQERVAQRLKDEFNVTDAENWVRAMMDIWFFMDKPDKHRCSAEVKQQLLSQLNVDDSEFFTLSTIVRHLNKIATDYDTSSYLLNTEEAAGSKLLNEKALSRLADMIADIGDFMAKEKMDSGRADWIDRRDVEFAIAVCKENDPSRFKVKLEHVYDLTTGEDKGAGWIKIVHVQNRPINPEKEAEDPDNIIFKKKKVDKNFIKDSGIEPVAGKGLVGYGAEQGQLYVVDPYKNLAAQEEEVVALLDSGKKVIVVLEEMGPEHDPIVEAAGAAIVWRGNDTSHAYIFGLEQRIPIVIGAVVDTRFQLYIEHGSNVVISGVEGEIWPGDKNIPLLKDNMIIRTDMLPDTKAGVIASTLSSAQEISRLGGKSALTRIEFLINQMVKIYPQAAYAYDLLIAINSGKMMEKELTPEELKDVRALQRNPEVLKEIKATIVGFNSATEFVTEQMRYIANATGILFPKGNKIRDYDNKEKEALLYGLIGAKLYLKYDDESIEYDSPLWGMRGSQLMIHPHFSKGYKALRRGILKSIKDGVKSNHFFFVYLRNPWELKIQLEEFEKLCEEEGVYPEELGVMIEVGNNAWFIDETLDLLNAFLKKHEKDGVKKVFISFGTNDLTHSTGNLPREDRDFTDDMVVMDPILTDVDPEKGRIELELGVAFGPAKKGKSFIIKLNDEAAPVISKVIEHVASRALNMNVARSLCGQYITLSLNRGNTKAAMRTAAALDSFGTQTNKMTPAAMMDFDTNVAELRLAPGSRKGKSPIAEVSVIAKEIENGVLTGDIVMIDKPEDINNLRGESRQKIAVIRTKLGTAEELEAQGIKWDYLKYSGAIFIDERLDQGFDVIMKDPEIKSRVKARITMKKEIKTGANVTVSFQHAAMYSGTLATRVEKATLQEIRMPKEGLVPENNKILRISVADLFVSSGNSSELAITDQDAQSAWGPSIDVHPLAFYMYGDEVMQQQLSSNVRNRIKRLIKDKDPLDYLQIVFSDYIYRKTLEAKNKGMIPVYTTFKLTRNQLRALAGGEKIEKSRGKEGGNFDDPLCRLMGGARNISDFWPIHHVELAAFSEVRHHNAPDLVLQLTTKGTRAQEVLEAQLRVLASNGFGITPENTTIGLELSSAADVLLVEDYIKQGISFFSYDTRELASVLLAANLHHPEMFVVEGKENMIKWAIDAPLKYVKGIIAENKDKGVWFGLRENQVLDTSFDRTIIDNRVNNRGSIASMQDKIPVTSKVMQVAVDENSAMLVGRGI